MEVYEIAGYRTGVDNSGVNFLDPADAFEQLRNGYIYRQELQSRKGFVHFGNQLGTQGGETADSSRVMGIFQNVNPQSSEVTTLAVSKNFLYQYDPATNMWDQIPFNARLLGLDPTYSFGIASNKDYVSGTTYPAFCPTCAPAKVNEQRFVLCSRGMTEIYFYNGTDVGVYTNTTDNKAYEAPSGDTLDRATYVAWFANRINFFKPVLTAVEFPQSILFSAEQNNSGNGDKFNTPGSGRLDADTYELMTGMNPIADYMIINFQRSNWTIRKTRDAFNPYFIEKTPSVLGTDASFSAVAWNYEVKSAGKTGMISTDGRQSVRFDNKIPYLASSEIDQAEFELTYGGFDRVNGQFLFSYRRAGSNLSATTQDRVLVYNYEESTWAIYDERFSVFGQSDAGETLDWDSILVSDEHPTWGRMDTTEELWNEIGITSDYQKTLAGDNQGFIYKINDGFDDYFVAVSAISKADSAVATISESAFQIGDQVVFKNIEGMTEINDKVLNVTASSGTSITVDIDSNFFSTFTAGGTVEKVIDFEAKLTPFNPYRSAGRRCFVSHIEVLLNSDSNDLFIDVFEDEEEAPFKTIRLIPDENTTKDREWITAVVDQEANFLNFVLRNQAYEKQTIISSIRIHAKPGGLTSG